MITNPHACPNRRIEIQCQIIVQTETLRWSIPGGEILSFNIQNTVGDVFSSSDDVYSATLTGKTDNNDPNTDRFFFTSTLLVLQPVNGSTLTCGGAAVGDQVENSTTITISGMYSSDKKIPIQRGPVVSERERNE